MWIRDVELPDELVTAASEGKLVLFVGAGASMSEPSGLPSFDGLVREIERMVLGQVPSLHDQPRASFVDWALRVGLSETQAADGAKLLGLGNESLDVRLGRLAYRGAKVHKIVSDILGGRDSAPNSLHSAIVALAAATSCPRIVTTNYDTHLSRAAEEAGLDLDVFEAPALPIGDDFEGIVHLHGSLRQEPRRMVVTDADFGRAYVTDSWATRFLERMFEHFTVLFIGYSHNDLVMKYLARSLRPGSKRFVCTQNPRDSNWDLYGLTPVAYPADAGHSVLPEFIERWAELATMSQLDHQARVANLVQLQTPNANEQSLILTPEEESYLDSTIADPVRVKYFVENARGLEWLNWVAQRPSFSALFDGARSSSVEMVALCRWVMDNFALAEPTTHAALKVMNDKPWPRATRAVITAALSRHEGAVDGWLSPWVWLVMQNADKDADARLDALIARADWGSDVDLALTLLEHLTAPILEPAPTYTDSDRVDFTVTSVGSEYALARAWKRIFVPLLGDHLPTIAASLDYQIARFYRWHHVRGSSFDGLSFRRSAIEPHEQDSFREIIDVLIDAARDCVEYALTNDPEFAASLISLWEARKEALFQRLTIHAWRIREDRTSDQKIEWITQGSWLWEGALRHEVFLLLADATGGASVEATDSLIGEILAGPPEGFDSDLRAYEVFNVLAWLSKSLPDNASVASAFGEIQAAHPGFGVREHPDLISYMEFGFVENASPYTGDKIHAMIAEDPAGAMEHLRRTPSDGFAVKGQTREGAMRTLRDCIAAHPTDGFRLSPVLLQGDEDARVAIIQGWGSAQIKPDQTTEVLNIIDEWVPQEVRRPALQMLSDGGTTDHPTAWHTLPRAWQTARGLWPVEDEPGVLADSSNVLSAAINSSAGYSARFWTRVVQWEWNQAGDGWTGLPNSLREQLDFLLDSPNRNGLFACTYLASQLHFYFAADRDWAESRLLLLFDWRVNSTLARGAWDGFLSWGRLNGGLLAGGLLDMYMLTLTHFDELDDEMRRQLSKHLAVIALNRGFGSVDGVMHFLQEVPEELRVMWADELGFALAEWEPDAAVSEWQSWIERYWSLRLDGIPSPLSTTEASTMAGWLIGLTPVLSEAVALLRRTEAGLSEGQALLSRLEEIDLQSAPREWVLAVTHLLGNTTAPTWDAQFHLESFVRRVRAADPTMDLSALIEQAMRLGFTSAHEW